MSQFSRRARWLNQLFPASVAPTIRDPGVRSDDVSLTQPYDGSGWGLPGPNDWVRRMVSVTGPTGSIQILNVGPDQIFRLLSADFVVLVGPNPDFVYLNCIDRAGTGDQIALSLVENPLGAGATLNEPIAFREVKPIVGSSCFLRLDWLGGLGATQLALGIYGVLAPVGTVFYV